ncbi:MAG: DUF2213 domain-containing protein [Erysipelotrichaceae bacterium]|nr:DUF2213 domain-containing protein [Erysipelotrichaceae bacterium]
MKMLATIKLSEHKYKTPEGYLICKDAVLSRTGKQQYLLSEIFPDKESDEIVDVDRKATEVFDDLTMASFENKPICVEHPDVDVGPENYADLAVGHTFNIHRGKSEGQDVMLGDLLITDQPTIEDIENGVRTDLSCGYDCDIEDDGKGNYSQINIRGNHVALCEQGRAGIARIQDSKKEKKEWGIESIKDKKASFDSEKLLHAMNDICFTQANSDYELPDTAKKWINQLILHDLVNRFNRQLTPEEKEFVKANGEKIYTTIVKEFEPYIVYKKSFTSPLGEIGDTKPMTIEMRDSVSKGTLIQEFGKQGKQYKVSKIVNNVIYAESLETGKTVLFKKDEENIEWAIITKSEVKDSIKDKMTNRVIVKDPKSEEYDYFHLRVEHHRLVKRDGIIYNATSYRNDDWFKSDSDNEFATYEEAEKKAKEILEKTESEDKENEYTSADIYGVKGQGGYLIAYLNSYDTGRLSPEYKKEIVNDSLSKEMFNGHLQDLDIEELVLRMKKRGESINSVRIAPNGKVITIFIYGHGSIEQPRDLYVSIIEENRDGSDQERIFSRNFKTYEDLIAAVETWKREYLNNIVKKEYTGDAAALDPRIIESIHDILGEDVKIDFGTRGQNIVIRYAEEVTPYMAKANIIRLISALEKLGIKVDNQMTIKNSNTNYIEVWHDSNLSLGDIRQWKDSVSNEEHSQHFYQKAMHKLQNALKRLNREDTEDSENEEEKSKSKGRLRKEIKEQLNIAEEKGEII